MKAFLVDLENRPGELARVTEAIAARGVNITAISGSTCGTGGRVALMTGDDATAETAIRGTGATVQILDVVETALRHAPGSLAKATRRLADAGINIEALMPTGMSGDDVMVAFVTDQPVKAREILAGAGASA